MSSTKFTCNICIENEDEEVSMSVIYDIDNLNIHIEDSWVVSDSHSIKNAVTAIMQTDCFKLLAAAGYTRTKESLIREWKAHNLLYTLGVAQAQTKSVDLDQKEPWYRLLGYFILSLVY